MAAGFFAASADGLAKFADGLFTADASGRAKFADEFVTADKLAATLDLSGKTLTLPAANTPAFTKSYTSTAQTITSGGTLTLAHGLGVVPSLIQIQLKCIDAGGEAGYAQNDVAIIGPAINGLGAGQFLVIVPDATNINVRYPQAATCFEIGNKGTGTGTNLTNTKWNMIVKAWA